VPNVPAGNDVVAIASAVGAFTVTVIAWLDELLAASVTSKVTDALLLPVGVPLIVPVLLVKLKPAGKAPELTVHLKGPVPPDSLNVVVYAVPAVAAGMEVVLMAGSGFTLICNVEDFVASEIDVAVMIAVNTVVTDAGAS
jgi:hypothetical protein